MLFQQLKILYEQLEKFLNSRTDLPVIREDPCLWFGQNVVGSVMIDLNV